MPKFIGGEVAAMPSEMVTGRSVERQLRTAKIVLLAAVAVGWPALARCQAEDRGANASAEQVHEVLSNYCLRCHGSEKQEADLSLKGLVEAKPDGVPAADWKKLLEQVADQKMPPVDEPQPSDEQRKRLIAWVTQQLKQGGETVDAQRTERPAQGNLVDHDELFSGKSAGPIGTRGRLWRLTGDGYREFVLSLSRQHYLGINGNKLRPPWELSPHNGFRDYANQHRIGEPEIEHHLRIARQLARGMLGKLNKTSGIQEFKVLVRAEGETTPEQIEAAAVAAVDGILGRAPTDRERQRYTTFLQSNLEQLGTHGAIEQLLVAVLCHPEVMYRIELPTVGETRSLPPARDLSRSISYALTDQEPDEALRAAALSGELTNSAQVRSHVERILADEQIAKPRVLRFFQEYFGYTRAPDVFKDEETRKAAGLRGRGGWQPDIFVSDTDQTVLWILRRDQQVLRELLTTTHTFTATGESREAQRVLKNADRDFDAAAQTALDIYEIETTRAAWSPDRAFRMPAEHRRGILTHPSWLIANSTNFDNHAIARGHWVRERFLGGKVPDVPVTVDAQLPDEPENTLRSRMRVTREAYCWRCHQKMDPLGLPFEQFDHFGRFRDTEAGEAVDTRGGVIDSGDPRLDGPVANPLELLERLAASPRVEQVFVRHAFRYFIGRNETLADGPVLIAAHKAYADNDGSMNALIASLLSSDAFLYRLAQENMLEKP